MKKTLVTLSALVLTPLLSITSNAYDLAGIDTSSIEGRALTEDEKGLFKGSWAEVYISSDVNEDVEKDRNSECGYIFGQSIFDNEAAEDLPEMEPYAPGLTDARGKLFITSDQEGNPVFAENNVFSTVIKRGEFNRIRPIGNGWFEAGFYSKYSLEPDGETWSWKKATSLDEGQIFNRAVFQIRLVNLPSGPLVPVMRDVTYGIPDWPNNSKVLMRCENYTPPAQPQQQ